VEVAPTADFDAATTVASGDLAPDARECESPLGDTPMEPRHHEIDGVSGRYVRVVATSPFTYEADTRADADLDSEAHGRWACFALAGISIADTGGECVSTGVAVSASSSVATDTWDRSQLSTPPHESRVGATSPQLRTELSIQKPVRRARLHVATLGYGEAAVNGQRVSDSSLDPAWTDYDARVLYSSYDVTEQLSTGDNAVGVWLGRGWFSKTGRFWVGDGSPRARVTLRIEHTDGTTRTVATDEQWQARHSPIVHNDIYDGETYDAREEIDGWATPGTDPTEWAHAAVVSPPDGTLQPQRVESMRPIESLTADTVSQTAEQVVLDFGENIAGWLAIPVDGLDAGDELTVRHAETLTEDGTLQTADLRSAAATDRYIAASDSTGTYEPRFTYHGFRYAAISGPIEKLDLTAVRAKVVTTAMEQTGAFDCSDGTVGQLQENAVRGLRGTAHSIPEDCPQRDERFGWTGDAHIAARALLFNLDGVRFHRKWLRDHDDAASAMGYVPDVIPTAAPETPGDPTWTVTRVLLPWHCYRHYGDEAILREQYAGMRSYIDYWHDQTDERGLLPESASRYGDWVSPAGRQEHLSFFGTAFLYHATETFAKIAGVLDQRADSDTYGHHAATLRDDFNEAFLDGAAGTYEPAIQATNAIPLYFGLVPDTLVDDVAASLVEIVDRADTTLRTGFLSTRPLLHALADHGYPNRAFELITQPERPGWGYMLEHGATTMWEHWNSDERIGSGMNSLNHAPFTHVSEFFYEVIAGIRIGDRPVTDTVGIAPTLIDDLQWAEGRIATPNGRLESHWERVEGGYDLAVRIPWNCAATVRLPDAATRTVRESGTEVTVQPPSGIDAVERDGTELVVTVGAGDYEFTTRESSRQR
jgi:alpha-L-rhamnosidase